MIAKCENTPAHREVSLIDDCGVCGAPVCCPACCREAALEAEVARLTAGRAMAFGDALYVKATEDDEMGEVKNAVLLSFDSQSQIVEFLKALQPPKESRTKVPDCVTTVRNAVTGETLQPKESSDV